MEYFDLLNDAGEPTGAVKERNLVHRDGDLHGGSHVWVIRRREENGRTEVLLQKRREDKESFPGCLDISCAGHVRAGESFLEAAVRELKEELSLEATPEDLVFLHRQRVDGDYVFHGIPFRNHEINFVYLLRPDFPLDGLCYLEEEIAGLVWKDAEVLCYDCAVHGYGAPAVTDGEETFCIDPGEAEQLLAYLNGTQR